jgi:hypothetical protein
VKARIEAAVHVCKKRPSEQVKWKKASKASPKRDAYKRASDSGGTAQRAIGAKSLRLVARNETRAVRHLSNSQQLGFTYSTFITSLPPCDSIL